MAYRGAAVDRIRCAQAANSSHPPPRTPEALQPDHRVCKSDIGAGQVQVQGPLNNYSCLKAKIGIALKAPPLPSQP